VDALPSRRRVLILGATGMLGHRLWSHCAERFEATATVRQDSIPAAAESILDPQRTITGLGVGDPAGLDATIRDSAPDVVVNCVGLVKQRPEAADPVALVAANSLFPHQVEEACGRHGARLIQISTDCVFSGERGNYAESDRPDPADLYGRSKLAGEPEGETTLTLRTSMLGRELERASGLLEWVLSATGTISGFPNAIFTGPTTPVLCRLIGDLIEADPGLHGTWHVGAAPIAKLELLRMIRDRFGLEIEIEPDPSVRIDRSLDSSRLRERVGWNPPEWEEMIAELAEEESDAER
jgi:dTDP-4-dehydrorhamnose reductase